MTVLCFGSMIIVVHYMYSFGCTYDRRFHTQGTEIKAITYSNMQIHQKQHEEEKEKNSCVCNSDTYTNVSSDAVTNNSNKADTSAEDTSTINAAPISLHPPGIVKHMVDIFVIVDI